MLKRDGGKVPEGGRGGGHLRFPAWVVFIDEIRFSARVVNE